MKSLVVFLLCSIPAQAACVFTPEFTTVKVEWTAFKTSKKAPVKGTFKNVTTAGKHKAKTLEALLGGMTAKVDGMSVDSGNPTRDQNLTKSFFETFAGHAAFEGKIQGVKAIDPAAEHGTAVLALKMNGVSGKLPMKWSRTEQGAFEMTGSLNLNEFKAEKSVESLNKTCFDLHKGEDGVSKTWSDVDLKITASIKKSC